MAVVGALLVVAATSLATAAIMERQTHLADTLMGERDRVQAKWLLRGGLDWARVVLQLDARNNAVTLKNAVWAQPIAGLQIDTPDGHRRALFSGLIEDEQGKFNLTRLASGGQVNTAELGALQTLLSRLSLPSELADAIAQRVAQSQTGPGKPASAMALRCVEDLGALDMVDRVTVARLADFLTVLPGDTPVNVNTASAEVLSAVVPGLDLGLAHSLVQERDAGVWFINRANFLNRLNEPKRATRIRLDVRSDWFKVSGEVQFGHAATGMSALLQRQKNAPPQVRWVRS